MTPEEKLLQAVYDQGISLETVDDIVGVWNNIVGPVITFEDHDVVRLVLAALTMNMETENTVAAWGKVYDKVRHNSQQKLEREMQRDADKSSS